MRQQGEALAIEAGSWFQSPGIMDRHFMILELCADVERRIGTPTGCDVNRFLPAGNQVADMGKHARIRHTRILAVISSCRQDRLIMAPDTHKPSIGTGLGSIIHTDVNAGVTEN